MYIYNKRFAAATREGKSEEKNRLWSKEGIGYQNRWTIHIHTYAQLQLWLPKDSTIVDRRRKERNTNRKCDQRTKKNDNDIYRRDRFQFHKIIFY